MSDPGRAKFFAACEGALRASNDIQNMIHQGSQFYQRLGEILNKLYQNIMDYKMSREFEKNDLVTKLSGSQQQQQ